MLSLGSVQIRALPHRYLCCETQMELREWFATFLFVQVPAQGGALGEASIMENGKFASSYIGHQLHQGDFELLLIRLFIHSANPP